MVVVEELDKLPLIKAKASWNSDRTYLQVYSYD